MHDFCSYGRSEPSAINLGKNKDTNMLVKKALIVDKDIYPMEEWGHVSMCPINLSHGVAIVSGSA